MDPMVVAFIPLPLGALLMIIHLAEITAEAWRRAGDRSHREMNTATSSWGARTS